MKYLIAFLVGMMLDFWSGQLRVWWTEVRADRECRSHFFDHAVNTSTGGVQWECVVVWRAGDIWYRRQVPIEVADEYELEAFGWKQRAWGAWTNP